MWSQISVRVITFNDPYQNSILKKKIKVKYISI